MSASARLSRGPRSRLASLAVVTWLLSACGGAVAEPQQADTPEPIEPTFTNSEQVKAEYEAAKAIFPAEFPEGVELPSIADRIDEPRHESASYQQGYAESELVMIWRCAWQRSYWNASRSGDQVALDQAADQLSRRFYELDAVTKYVDDPDRLWHKHVIAPAMEGDFEPLAEDLVNSCGKPFVP